MVETLSAFRVTQRLFRVPVGRRIVVPHEGRVWIINEFRVVPGTHYKPPTERLRPAFEGELVFRIREDSDPEFRGSVLALMDENWINMQKERPVRNADFWREVGGCLDTIERLAARILDDGIAAPPPPPIGGGGGEQLAETYKERIELIYGRGKLIQQVINLGHKVLDDLSGPRRPTLPPMAFNPGDSFVFEHRASAGTGVLGEVIEGSTLEVDVEVLETTSVPQ